MTASRSFQDTLETALGQQRMLRVYREKGLSATWGLVWLLRSPARSDSCRPKLTSFILPKGDTQTRAQTQPVLQGPTLPPLSTHSDQEHGNLDASSFFTPCPQVSLSHGAWQSDPRTALTV